MGRLRALSALADGLAGAPPAEADWAAVLGKLRADGGYVAASDWRRDGQAAGF